MKLLNSKTKRMVAAALVLSAGAVGIVMVATPLAHALPPTAWERAYYSDENFQNQVGNRYLECDGSRGGWGTTSGYSKVEWTEGCGAPGSWSTKCWTYTDAAGMQRAQCIGVNAFPPPR